MQTNQVATLAFSIVQKHTSCERFQTAPSRYRIKIILLSHHGNFIKCWIWRCVHWLYSDCTAMSSIHCRYANSYSNVNDGPDINGNNLTFSFTSNNFQSGHYYWYWNVQMFRKERETKPNRVDFHLSPPSVFYRSCWIIIAYPTKAQIITGQPIKTVSMGIYVHISQ